MNQTSPFRATGTGLRPFTIADAPAVAGLFITVMRRGKGRATPALADYLASHFLSGPFANPAIPSLVAIDAAGAVIGFIGVTSHEVRIGDTGKTVAVGSTLMVRDHARDPMTGARLLRTLLSGPQHATLTETSSPESLPMWERMGGETLPLASLDWVRILRPAAFGLAIAARAAPPLRHLGVLTRPFDALARRALRAPGWTGLPKTATPRGGAHCVPLDRAGFIAAASSHFASGPAHSLYTPDGLERVIGDAMRKPGWGAAHLRAIVLPDGRRLGVALYHYDRGGIARINALVAPPETRAIVLDAVIAEARDNGAAGVMGRTDPALFEALSRRRVAFLRASATIIHGRDETLRAALRQGELPLNGLFGERWSRLMGDSTLWH